MLEHSLKDRKGNDNPPQNNHQSKHSIGSILLLIAGFESWLNEALVHLSYYDPQFRQKGNNTAIKKYEDIYNLEISPYFPSENVKKLDAEQKLRFNEIKENLEIVFEVRNEIAHAMPRPTGCQWDVPPHLMALQEKGLLITRGDPKSDYSLYQKLRSYALCYWCWEIVNSAVSLVIKRLEPDQVLAWTAQNFSMYKNIACPPEELLRYDLGKWRRKG